MIALLMKCLVCLQTTVPLTQNQRRGSNQRPELQVTKNGRKREEIAKKGRKVIRGHLLVILFKGTKVIPATSNTSLSFTMMTMIVVYFVQKSKDGVRPKMTLVLQRKMFRRKEFRDY